jgi:hypothetical protein
MGENFIRNLSRGIAKEFEHTLVGHPAIASVGYDRGAIEKNLEMHSIPVEPLRLKA